MKPTGTFKATNPLHKRFQKSHALRALRAEARIPTIVEHTHHTRRPALLLAKTEFLVPAGLTAGMFLCKLRESLKSHLKKDTAVYLMAGGMLVLPSMEMGMLDREFGDEDGYLYLVWAEESTFG